MNTKQNFKPTKGEINGYEFGVFTERAGYRSAKSQIEGFLYAGEHLKAARAGAFDSDDFDPVEDPSLEIRDHELSEIGMDMQRAADSLERSSNKAKPVEVVEEAAKASDSSEN